MKTEKEKIFVFGTGGHAKAVIDVLLAEAKQTIVGLIGKTKEDTSEFYKHKIIGCDDDILQLAEIYHVNYGIVAVGDNATRKKIVTNILKLIPDFKFVSAVHPSAIISSSVEILPGSVIMPGVIINAESKIGKHCILNTGAIVDHDCEFGDFIHIAPGATIAGSVAIGNLSCIYLGANIINNIRIGTNVTVGAGATVLNSVASNKIVFGVPARENV